VVEWSTTEGFALLLVDSRIDGGFRHNNCVLLLLLRVKKRITHGNRVELRNHSWLTLLLLSIGHGDSVEHRLVEGLLLLFHRLFLDGELRSGRWLLHINLLRLEFLLLRNDHGESGSLLELDQSDQDTRVSHANSLNQDNQESNQIDGPAAFVAVENQIDNSDQGEDVLEDRIYKVGHQHLGSLANGTNDSQRNEDGCHDPVKEVRREDCHHQLKEGQEDNPSSGLLHHAHFGFTQVTILGIG